MTDQETHSQNPLQELQERGGLKRTDIANCTGVTKKTVSRWGNGESMPNKKSKLIISELLEVVERLHVYYSHEEVREWLCAEHPQLDGERAIDVIHEDRTEEVMAILDRLDANAYI